MSEQVSFLRLARSFFEHPLWKEERELSRAEAWLWLLANASFASEGRWVGDCCLTLQRGEQVASVRDLSCAWRWKKHRVERFLKSLKESGMIRTESRTGKTVISLVNYRFFNPGPDTIPDDSRTDPGQDPDTPYIREGKEGEKEIEREAPEMAGGEGIPPVTLEKAQKIAEMRGICTREIVEKWWLINDSKNWEGVRKWESSLKGYAVHMKGVESQNRIKGRGGAAGRNGGLAVSRVAKGVGAVAEVL